MIVERQLTTKEPYLEAEDDTLTFLESVEPYSKVKDTSYWRNAVNAVSEYDILRFGDSMEYDDIAEMFISDNASDYEDYIEDDEEED